MARRSIPQPPIPASHVFLSLSSSLPRRPSSNIKMTMMMMKLAAVATAVATHNKLKPIRLRFGESLCLWLNPYSPRFSFVKAAPENTSNLATADDYRTVAQIKQDLFAALQGIDRGIFGVPSEKKTQIHSLVELLESHNSIPQPTLCLEKVAGAWKLIYSTITILGSRRTKLGLRDFITLGDFFQSINVAEAPPTLNQCIQKELHNFFQFFPCFCTLFPSIIKTVFLKLVHSILRWQMEGKAVNVIKFSAKGLNLLSGQLTIDASFKIASKSRVDVNYNKSMITPIQLMNVFRKNYDLLLQIFNPEGWLEITYVDDSLRIGRDDKGNIFILERLEDYNPERFC